MTTLNNAISIQMTIYATFLVKSFQSFHCHVFTIYIIPLYKIIVTANAIVRDNNILVTFMIIEGADLTENPFSIFIHHWSTAFHTVSTFSQIWEMFSFSYVGFIACHSKSFTAPEKLPNSNGIATKANK